MMSSAPPNPETLPVIVVHHGAQGHMVYCSQPCLVLHIDDGMPHDRMVVISGHAVPAGLMRGPVDHTLLGNPVEVARKARFVDWLVATVPGVFRRSVNGVTE